MRSNYSDFYDLNKLGKSVNEIYLEKKKSIMFQSFFSLVYSGIKFCDENNNKKKGEKERKENEIKFCCTSLMLTFLAFYTNFECLMDKLLARIQCDSRYMKKKKKEKKENASWWKALKFFLTRRLGVMNNLYVLLLRSYFSFHFASIYSFRNRQPRSFLADGSTAFAFSNYTYSIGNYISVWQKRSVEKNK